MLQQTPYLLLTRPLTFFGNFQQMEEELCYDDSCEEDEEFSTQWDFMTDSNKIKTFDQKIGLFIHWFDN